MAEEFKPLGAIVLIVGTVVNDAGQPVRDTMQVQAQGICQPLELDREGVAQIQIFLTKAMDHYTMRSVEVPSRAEATGDKPLVVPASMMPNMRGFSQ